MASALHGAGEVEAAETSPLYERVAIALSESDEALREIEAAPARRRHPTVILAAPHDLALGGPAPALGDRRASGHSIIGLAAFDRSALRVEARGRCWSQGRFLAWLGDS